MINANNSASAVVLIAQAKNGSVQSYAFESDGGVFVGRSANCGMQLPGDSVSDIHCRVELCDGDLWIQDWMSKQGTFVDGTAIETKTLLEPLAICNLGDYVIKVQHNRSFESPEPESNLRDEIPGNDTTGTAHYEMSIEQAASTSVSTARHIPESDCLATIDTFELPSEPEPFDFDADFPEEETYDRETVDLLRAEIADLQAALAARDAEAEQDTRDLTSCESSIQVDSSDALLSRMQDLLDEAQRSDERVELLEEMLNASELANRSEHEERNQLEGWVGEIERRIGQREEEHSAELKLLQQRLDETLGQRDQLQRKLQMAASHGTAPKQYEETLENLQQQNRALREHLDAATKENAFLLKKIENTKSEESDSLREERAAIAQERAKISRLRFELSNRLKGLDDLPKQENEVDRETALRLKTLRQHLREIHEEEKREAEQASLATRVKKLWTRVEY